MAKTLNVVVYWDDSDPNNQKAVVWPPCLVIDRNEQAASIEFHSFLDHGATLVLPPDLFGSKPRALPKQDKVTATLPPNPNRGCHAYRITVEDHGEAQGNSIPRMIVLP